ncbi:MAG: pyruvate kinase [Deltaproteobacteria bacterium]|nr:pyruvate kinase [Deltaproteobacteria bacterium]MBW1951669.1 pyruvate kinase [Deltaproteobacteria bacterium]MBW1985768.1 pyruvate kinase [Deltaproteobacteria bacterium]MBW2134683.1 pyruvate kinase [Deltaproteobacteria bacterium]
MDLHFQRRTKIVCTLGPACRGEVLSGLIEAGMNVARLNFSHGTQEEHRQWIRQVRGAAQALGKPVAVLQDLAGPKIRLGEFYPERVNLSPGQSFTLTNRPIIGDQHQGAVNYPELIGAVPVGASILLADGLIQLQVQDKSDTDLHCRVVVGGTLSSHKGINLPSLGLPISAMTAKDREDLLFGLKNGVDLIALSYVRYRHDVEEVKELIKKHGFETPVIAKIEKQKALENLEEILAVADGLMVARGDLGVETPLERVPLVQKHLIEAANRVGKPVITATQMLASMVSNPNPSRAEATDVANAIMDGTDAVMLSEETAIGLYPREAVKFMDRIARATEASLPYEDWLKTRGRFRGEEISDVISYAACGIADDLKAQAILATTASGSTARLISRFRPKTPIIGITPLVETWRRLCLSWGVFPLLCRDLQSTDHMLSLVKDEAVRTGWVARGDRVIVTAGTPIGIRGTTNLIKADIIT